MQFIIYGQPISKMRARTVKRGSYTQTYDPQTKEKNEVHLQLLAQAIDQGFRHPTQARYRVEFEFHMSTPKSLSQSAQKILLWTQYPAKKPDLDNLAKFYLDAANGALWTDDEQIVQASILKLYSEKPKTIIRVYVEKQIELDEKSREILSLFTPNEIDELAGMMLPWVGGINVNDKSAPLRMVYILSSIADAAGSKFAKIAKKYPAAWREDEE